MEIKRSSQAVWHGSIKGDSDKSAGLSPLELCEWVAPEYLHKIAGQFLEMFLIVAAGQSLCQSARRSQAGEADGCDLKWFEVTPRVCRQRRSVQLPRHPIRSGVVFLQRLHGLRGEFSDVVFV